jgi:hypothetical protein
MTSIKHQIRQRMVERLNTCEGLQGRIFDTPLQSFEHEQLPLLIMTVEKDQVLDDWTSMLMTTFARNALIQLRELALNLTIVAKANPHVVQELDYLATQITTCLLDDRKLGGLCKTLRFQEATEISAAEEGEKPVCSLVLHCLVWYRQVDFMPDTLAI